MTEATPLRWGRIVFVALLFALCIAAILVWPLDRGEAPAPPRPAAPMRLFVGVDLTKLPESERLPLLEAETDFVRVLKGLPPLCKAEIDSAYSDGGTVIYECKHYQLMVVHQIFSFEGGDGYLYGPQITFRDSKQTVSDIRYYSGADLALLLKGPGTADRAQ